MINEQKQEKNVILQLVEAGAKFQEIKIHCFIDEMGKIMQIIQNAPGIREMKADYIFNNKVVEIVASV